MRTLILLTFLLASNFVSFGQIEYLNQTILKHEKIDLSNQTYWIESSPNKWRLIGKLDFQGINKSELPDKPECFVWVRGEDRILSIEGSGQVYVLSSKTLTFRRDDQTYFRGYNFGALKFVRKDTLYSYGGLGFWHLNNVETFYNPLKKEWDLVRHSTNSPLRILNNLSGYNHVSDLLSVIEAPEAYEDKNSSPLRYFEFDFSEKKWIIKGAINMDLLEELGIHALSADFIHGFFIFRNGLKVIVADPSKNQLYQFDGGISDFFDVSYDLIEKGDKIFSLKYNNKINSLQPLKIDSLSIGTFRNHLTAKGSFYNVNLIDSHKAIYISVIIFLFITVIILTLKLRAAKSSMPLLFGLSPQSIEFLKACLEFPPGHEFTSSDFTEMMGYASYSFETQRQVRSKQIISINEYFSQNHKMEGVIERFSAKDDKRFSLYRISDIHYQNLKELLA